jgi:phenylacetate-CoA ligase
MMGLEERVYTASPPWLRTLLMNAHALRIGAHRYGAPFRARLEEFDAMGRADQAVLDAYQETRLRAILRMAVVKSAYYRELFAQLGESPDSVGTLATMSRIPLLSKETVRNRGSELLTSPVSSSGWLHGHTSGTTGSPLSLWYDRQTCIATNAVERLQKRWAGVADDEWVGLLLGRQVVPERIHAPPYWHANHIQRQVWFSSLHLSSDTLPAYVAEIRHRGLRVLEGYPSTLYVLARFLLDRGERLPLRAVFSSSETLLTVQREAIEAAFGAPLFDFYGHAERAIFAIECVAHEGKHLVSPFGITEVVDVAGTPVQDGVSGFLVGTSLFNTAMPMIRYRTGDISAIDRSPCVCGSRFPRIVGVSTKAEDLVVLPDGRWLSPSALTHPFKPFPEIVESQIIQESPQLILVKVVAGDDFTPSRESALLAALSQRLGSSVTVRLERVASIPRENSGKFRWVISRVSHELSVSWQ